MTDEMDPRWKPPEHLPNDQYGLWAVERVWFRLREQYIRSLDGEQVTDPACKIVWEVIQPMRQALEDQGLDGFDAFMARHRSPSPEVGPHPVQPNLTEEEAEKWWSSKTPRERYAALHGGSPDGPDPGEVVLVGFGIIGETCRSVSPSAEKSGARASLIKTGQLVKKKAKKKRTLVKSCLFTTPELDGTVSLGAIRVDFVGQRVGALHAVHRLAPSFSVAVLKLVRALSTA